MTQVMRELNTCPTRKERVTCENYAFLMCPCSLVSGVQCHWVFKCLTYVWWWGCGIKVSDGFPGPPFIFVCIDDSICNLLPDWVQADVVGSLLAVGWWRVMLPCSDSSIGIIRVFGRCVHSTVRYIWMMRVFSSGCCLVHVRQASALLQTMPNDYETYNWN